MSAAFRLATDPVKVNEADPFEPVNVNPVVVASVNAPCVTVSVSESAPGPASTKLIALPLPEEKTSEPFSLNTAVAGAVIAGTPGLTVNATLAEPSLPSPGSETEIASESEPA